MRSKTTLCQWPLSKLARLTDFNFSEYACGQKATEMQMYVCVLCGIN